MTVPQELITVAFISNDSSNNPGSIYLDGGNITSNGAGGLALTGLGLAMSTAVPQAIATGTAAILIPVNTSVVRISAAAAVTGATLPVGTKAGQILILIVTTAAANTITFAASGTSNVAAGVSLILNGLAKNIFIWDSVGLLWY
jgi:hypothetical protein